MNQTFSKADAVEEIAPAAYWRKLSSLRGEMAWIVFGQAAGAVGGVVGVRMMTHVLTPAAYGQLALGLTLTTLLQQSILSPFTGSALRFFAAARDAGELDSFIEALKSVMGNILTIVAAVVIAVLIGVACGHYSEWIPLAIWCVIFALLGNLNQVLDGMQNAARQRVIVAWHDGASVWLRFMLGASIAAYFGRTAAQALIGYTCSAILIAGSQSFFFRRVLVKHLTGDVNSEDVTRWRRSIVGYSLPIASWGFFAWVQSASERWSLQYYGDATQVGQYAVLFQVGYYPVTMASGLLVQLVAPIVFDVAGDGNDASRLARCRRWTAMLTTAIVAGSVAVAVLASMFSGQVFAVVSPKSYWGGSPFLGWMVLASGLFAAGQVAALSLQSDLMTHYLRKPKIATALLAVLLNVLGARYFGLRGVIAAGVAFAAVHTIWISALAFGRRG